MSFCFRRKLTIARLACRITADASFVLACKSIIYVQRDWRARARNKRWEKHFDTTANWLEVSRWGRVQFETVHCFVHSVRLFLISQRCELLSTLAIQLFHELYCIDTMHSVAVYKFRSIQASNNSLQNNWIHSKSHLTATISTNWKFPSD